MGGVRVLRISSCVSFQNTQSLFGLLLHLGEFATYLDESLGSRVRQKVDEYRFDGGENDCGGRHAQRDREQRDSGRHQIAPEESKRQADVLQDRHLASPNLF